MGVTYKLRDEVVQFIICQRQGNPLFSCRQLAEAASQKFGLNLSKSSVHDVLRESGITTPRGRKPKDKFEIPKEKKKQIQVNLSQVKLLPYPIEPSNPVVPIDPIISNGPPVILSEAKDLHKVNSLKDPLPSENDLEISPEYEGAGKIFLKAALWDLGIFAQENIKETEWNYYLTYSKGIKVVLENKKDFFIDLPLPLERCIRETADGLINNVKPFIVHKVSDEDLFKLCMQTRAGFNIENLSIVGQDDHILLVFNNIMVLKREFLPMKRYFMESKLRNALERSKALFFPQVIDNNNLMDNILNLKGFDQTTKDQNTITLLMDDSYENKILLQEAIEKLNGMYVCDEENRLVSINLSSSSP